MSDWNAKPVSGSELETNLFPLSLVARFEARLDVFEAAFQRFDVALVLCEEEVGAPVERVEAPVARPVLQRLVRVAHETLRREKSITIAAGYALRTRMRVPLGYE